MRLISLEFEDPAAGWKLCEFEFFNDITLLVGLSGVGKTRILDTLDRLKAVAQGKTSQQLFGVQWSLVFEHDNSKYEWKGKMSEDPLGQERDIQLPFLGDDDEDSNRPEFLSESLIRNGSRIAQRDHEEIYFSENKTPKLSRRESVISLFKNEDLLKPAYSGMQMILSVDHSEDSRARNFFRLGNLEPLKKKFVTVEAIRATDMPTHVKLALAYANCPEVFKEIVRQFRDAFPAVDRVEFKDVEAPHFGIIFRMFLFEQGVDKPIPEQAISSGMHRTLMHLSRMALWPDGTVVLIDEFENSFGVNCINFVTQDLVFHSQRMQFVLTSHHPYIINNISMKNWKIVSRKGRDVKVEDSSLLGQNSSHEAFLQLLNLPEYVDGIAIE